MNRKSFVFQRIGKDTPIIKPPNGTHLLYLSEEGELNVIGSDGEAVKQLGGGLSLDDIRPLATNYSNPSAPTIKFDRPAGRKYVDLLQPTSSIGISFEGEEDTVNELRIDPNSQTISWDASAINKTVYGDSELNMTNGSLNIVTAWNHDNGIFLKLYDTIPIPPELDEQAPIWTTNSITNVSDTMATYNAELNENATVYWYISTSSSGPSTKSDLRNGVGATAFDQFITTGSVNNTDSVTGLTEETQYYPFAYAVDSAGNETGIQSGSSFTTTAGIIVMQDNFDDNSIDASKWSVTNPNTPSITIREVNERLELDTSGANNISNQDFIQSVQTIDSGTIASNLLRSPNDSNNTNIASNMYLWKDISNFAAITRSTVTVGNARLIILSGGSSVYSFESSAAFNSKWKIEKTSGNVIRFYQHNGSNWIQVGTDTTAAIGNGLNSRYLVNNSDSSNVLFSVDNFYMTNANYSTIIP